MTILIAPSILSSNFARIGDAVRMAEAAGADLIHLDIMDGHFVPNLTFGAGMVSALRKETSLPLDVHLMVENPREFIRPFHEAGANWISIHLEATYHLDKDVSLIKDAGLKAGVALNPATPIQLLQDILPKLDQVMIMTVNPGWGGQAFIESSHAKIRDLRRLIRERGLDVSIEVDGGVDLNNMDRLIQDGANVFVAGATIFHSDNPSDVIARMKNIAKRYELP